MFTVFFCQTLTDTSGGLFGVWYRGIFTQHRLKQNTRHRWTFHRPTNPGVKPRFRLSPELKELLVWISYSAQETTLDIDSNRFTHWLSACGAASWVGWVVASCLGGPCAWSEGRCSWRGDVVLYVIIFDTQCISSYLKKISKYENVKNAKTYVIDIVYVVYT